MSIINKHWQGKFPLWVSFWLIGVVPLVLVRVFEPHWLKTIPLANNWAAPMVWSYAGVLLLLIFPWQAVGVLRSAFNHFETFGKSHILYIVQVFVVGGGIAAASHCLYTLQRFTALVDQHVFDTREPEERPTINLSDLDNTQLMFTGPITFGVTKDVREILVNNPSIRSVVLQSHGGQLYEGRGLALLFKEYELNTHVDTYCNSSCTTAFIGGVQRTMAATAQLGFHQYGLDANRPRQKSSAYDPRAEQVKDAELFLEQGVDRGFTDVMFKADTNDMWYPNTKLLLSTKVINRLLAKKNNSVVKY